MRSIIQAAAFFLVSSVVSAQDADRDSENGDNIEEIVVIGTDQSRYLVPDTSAITGFNLSFLENPRIVNQIPEQLILDQKITDLGEALRNTPGISQSDGFGGTNDDFLIRGFRRNTVYRNGFRRATNFKTNLSNVETVQVVRGPASITYGQVEPGGLVDIVTKKPLDEQYFSTEFRAGSFDDQLLLADWSQPITDAIAIRIVASTQDAESFRDFTDISRDTASLSGRFDLSSATSLNVSYEYRDESRPLDRGTITVATPDGREVVNNLLDVSISERFGEPFEIFESEFEFVDLTLEHNFNESWKWRTSAALEDSIADDVQARPRAVVILNEDAPIVDGFFTEAVTPEAVFDDPTDQVFLARRTDGSQERDTQVTYFNTILSGEFEGLGVDHRLAVGADYRDFEQTRFFVATATTDGIPVELGGNGPLFDISNPVFGNLPDTLSTEGLTLQTSEEITTGIFVNDYIDLNERVGLLLGVRWDSVELGDLDSVTEISPQIAVSVRANSRTSAFASFAEAFEPNSFVDLDAGPTTPFDPEDSRQFEVGAKSELAEGRLQLSGSLYYIQKQNVLTTDENGDPTLLDGQNSQGLEFSAVGQPISGMNIAAGYAFTDSEIDGGPNDANVGNQPRNVAENTANVWVSYEWQYGALEGLGLGGGIFYVDDRPGDDGNTFFLDAYTTADLSAWYSLYVPGLGEDNRIRFQAAIKNLFDEEFFPASGGNERINIGTPRSVFFSVALSI